MRILLFWLLLVGLLGAETRPAKVWVVKQSVTSVHRTPNERSELVTQALLWEKLEVVEQQGGWARVFVTNQYRTPKGYPGWVQASDIEEVAPFTGARTVSVAKAVLRASAESKAKPLLTAYLGTRLPLAPAAAPVSGWVALLLPDGRTGWLEEAQVSAEAGMGKVTDGSVIVDTAALLKGVPYLWGGMSEQGIDCSGLTYEAYKAHGYTLPRDADQQFSFGRPVKEDELQAGDLVFFGSSDDNITHVGIYMGQGKFMHASSSQDGVTVTPLEDPRYNPRFRGARRFLR